MARAKQTVRAEARRRYRQAAAAEATEPENGTELDYGERKPEAGTKAAARPARTADRQPTGRVGVLDSFRLAYHPAHVREDLRALPQLLRSWGLIAAVVLVVASAIALYLYPNYTGSQTVAELILRPGGGLAAALIAGFFATRASYLLGAIVGFVQAVSFVLVISTDRFQAAMNAIQPGGVSPPELSGIANAFVSGIALGAIFAAMAAWYRRFLSLSSPRRAQAARSNQRRSNARR